MKKQDPIYFKEYYEKNKEHRSDLSKCHYLRNKEKYKEKNRLYYLKNKKRDKIKKQQYNKEYIKLRKKNDPVFRAIYNIRNRLKKFFKSKGFKKRTKTINMIGCSLIELKCYLLSKFVVGMTWDNYGKIWHIDHIIPLSSSNTLEEIEKLSHYTNLQPLFAEDNSKKGAKPPLSN